jgi:uncharacterized protein (UPF0332 family)
MSGSPELDRLIRYRLDRAEEAYRDALSLANGKSWNGCINRLYYSCFYAVTALLAKDNLSSPKHTGVRGLFNKNYVRVGIISKELATVFNELFEYRQEADYTDFVNFEESQVSPFIGRVRDFLDTVNEKITSAGGS